MIQVTMLKELANRLNPGKDGNCFIDTKCYFGIGVKKCSAPKDYILKQHEEIKNKQLSINGSRGSLCPGNLNSDWPCSFFIEFVFIDPDM
jgi:hypothetical protein